MSKDIITQATAMAQVAKAATNTLRRFALDGRETETVVALFAKEGTLEIAVRVGWVDNIPTLPERPFYFTPREDA